MYVIFPADEIILLSYGFAQNPRLYQARPTLDRLREPTAPQSTIGTRPPPSPSTPTSANNSLTPNNHVRASSTNRDPSPSRVSFADDFMNKSRSSIVDESTFSKAGDFNSNSAAAINSSESAKKKNNKLKSKITKISLGKLGKVSASNEQLEAAAPTRVTEDQHLRIHNPTFTHDNLRQKNFDAFFASGEPVYSLEKREAALLTPNSYTDSYSIPSSYAPSPSTPITPPSFSSLSLPPLHRESSVGPLASALKSSTSKSSSTNSSSGSKRPKSAELYRTPAENSVKGDRCHENFVFGFFLVWF